MRSRTPAGAGRLLVGTSGFVYPHWKGVFYPEDLKETGWLAYYARSFPVVELNVTYYNLPRRETFRRWAGEVPEGFEFVLKGSRYVTHMKKLNDADDAVREFMSRATVLGDAFTCALWQFPANFRVNSGRLARFCEALRRLAGGVRHAFEFRHESWFAEEVYATLREHGCALVIAHSTRWPVREVVTAPFTYLRFHGGGGLYGSEYTDDQIREWAAKAKRWLAEGLDVYAFFNNDAEGFAVRNALDFARLAR